jgi:hypothetical protein
MTIDIVELVLVPPLTAGLAAWLTYLFTVRQSTGHERFSLRRSAADDLYLPLRQLQAVVRKHGRVEVTNAEAAFAFKTFFDSVDRQEHRLPDRWRHLSRSMRAAAGTALGAVSFVDLDPSVENLELAVPDAQWQDYADDYIDYVLHGVMVWGDSLRGGPSELLDFDKWLVHTGRREPFGS